MPRSSPRRRYDETKSVRVCISTRPTHRGSGIPIEIERAVEPHADM